MRFAARLGRKSYLINEGFGQPVPALLANTGFHANLYPMSITMIADQSATELFRANLRAAMDYYGITMTQLAEEAGTKRPPISRILSGEDGLSLARAERIAKAIGVPLDALIRADFSPEKFSR